MYIDAIYDRKNDKIQVVERVNGKRVYKIFPAKYVFYWDDPKGIYKNHYGNPISKYETNKYKEFTRNLALYSDKVLYEKDINPIFRCLSENYINCEIPKLKIGFFDIEVDFDPKKGFAKPWDPFSRITAISIYLTEIDKLITLVLKPDLPKSHPDYLSYEDAEKITSEFDNCFLCEDEENLLNHFLDIIDDCDVISGWNSTGYDIPYVINRIELLLGKDYSKRMCLWNMRPKKRKYIKFKKEHITYDLIGRIHLDYLDLYMKHNTQELHSYRLDFVGEIEVGENKIPYDGTLDQLYKQDFRKFIEYNRQDTLLLKKIDDKKKFIELANQLAHTNTVLLQTTMGSVALIEQAIINYYWELGMQVPSRKSINKIHDNEDEENVINYDEEEDEPVVGAYVAKPKVGIHNMIGCIDINSLYPSTLRALNMGPETLVGQIRSNKTDELIRSRLDNGIDRSEVWQGLFSTLEYQMVIDKSEEIITVDFEDGNTIDIPANQLYEYIFDKDNSYCITANGTIFRTDINAVIPQLLEKWYAQRKEMQAKAKELDKVADGFILPDDIINSLKS